MFWRLALAALAAAWALSAFWQAMKPMPPGTRIATAWYALRPADVSFLADTTAADAYGRPVVSQAIFDQMLAIVRGAREFIVLDYFLFNGEPALEAEPALPLRALSKELRDALIEQRRLYPALKILFVTDAINTGEGGVPSNDFAMLKAAGVDIVITDRRRLRDASYLCAYLWRLTMGRSQGHGRLESANHRRTIIADDGHGGLVGAIGSADPRDASSAFSNVALRLRGPLLSPLIQSELAIARFSGWRGEFAQVPMGAPTPRAADADPRGVRARITTEGAIRADLLEHIDGASKADHIDIAMFHIADRAIIDALLAANARGARVRLILEPEKNSEDTASIPNGPVASELITASEDAIRVRWYRSHGEQFHTKLVMVYGAARFWATLGSADLTRRNLADYDLNANVAIEGPRAAAVAAQMSDYFETLWSNQASQGIEYTADFAVYADASQARYWLYRLMDWSGIASF
jgi:phosphatidylserine/phosphatidylglycerophosphate/cardiolipin synthase-like enzyme